MRPGQVVVVTGASGAGKTTLVRALEAQQLPGVDCHYFDSVGVPTAEQMTAEFGSPAGWQAATLERWIARLASASVSGRVAVLDGQVRPSEVRAAFARHGVGRGEILLIDCGHAAREARLRNERGQPQLASADMACWAAYLRGQADAFGLPILDTTELTVGRAAQEFIARIEVIAAT